MWLEKLFLLLCHLYDDTAKGISEKADKKIFFFVVGALADVALVPDVQHTRVLEGPVKCHNFQPLTSIN